MSIVALLRLPDYRRVWLLGGIANAMRWLEILAGTLWVFEQTGSALAGRPHGIRRRTPGDPAARRLRVVPAPGAVPRTFPRPLPR